MENIKRQPNSQNKIIEIAKVSKRFYLDGQEITALQDVTFDIYTGELLAILGPSGSGKTTLLNLISGIDTPTTGRISIFGNNIASLTERKRTQFRLDHIGFVFQFFNLFPTLTTLENVALLLEVKGVKVAKAHERAAKILTTLGLGHRLDCFPDHLSGGEQQRVAVARALVTDAPIIICDEPTGNLDFSSGRETLAIMNDLNKKEGKTLIIVTHNTPIGSIADRVVHLRDGMVIEIIQNKNPKNPRQITW